MAIIEKRIRNACFRTQAVLVREELITSDKFITDKTEMDFHTDLLTLCGIDSDTYKETMESVLSDIHVMLEYLEWKTEEGYNFVELLSEIVEFNSEIEEYLLSKGLRTDYINIRFNKILL
ncbi:hypothetical protein [Enterobacter roggenkampii]|uniref:hypothetical protein n=1 Tax=Enterobacter roggenkampii TaxID=1812935 RepID=UPI0035D49B4A